MNFIYETQPSKVVFGAGSIQFLQREINALGAKRALILCTSEQEGLAQKIVEILGDTAVGIYAKAIMHVPIETAIEASKIAEELDADCAIAVGGGSTIGLGKAIALTYALPILAIPTTYSGSEMTPVYGITENSIKKTGKDPRVLPKTVIYDPELTSTLPLDMSITSGINAIAHAVEGLYARDSNPIMNLLAEEGIRSLSIGLKMLKVNAQDISARSKSLYGAWLCGYVLGNVGMALHHKLCHTLGGSFNLPHAPTHTVILPHAIAYNERATPSAMNSIKRALDVNEGSAAQAVYDLIQSLDGPTALSSLGLERTSLEKVTEIALANPYWNPEPIEKNAIYQLLNNAYDGLKPL